MTEADGWRWEFSPGTAADELGPAPQHLLETAELIKANPVRKVFRSGEFYLKLDLRTGNRLLREWRSAELLAARHIPMVEHLALGRSATGELLITRALPDAVQAGTYFFRTCLRDGAPAEEFAESLAEFARQIIGEPRTSTALLVILMTILLGTTDYLGAGMDVVAKAVAGETAAAAFLIKMVFTAVTLGSGFTGGEIVPTLFVGATFGCLFGQVTGLAPSLAAACGMAAVFCGVTNCPISSLLLSFELFGFQCMPFFLLSVSISYLESGYFGLYHSQKILYSKTKLQFINRQTKE